MAGADKNARDIFALDPLVLMERAAMGAADILTGEDSEFDLSSVLVVAGTGNNGGDALAVARLLFEAGIKSDVYICTKDGNVSGTPSFETQLKSLKAYRFEFLTELIPDRKYTTVIDGIFGISLNRDVEGSFARAVRSINDYRESGAKVLSLDMPSGVHVNTGQIMGVAVRADVTVTFGFYKIGQILYPGAENCGTLILKGIGIPDEAIDFTGARESSRLFVMEDKETVMPDRPAYSNKGTFGKVLLVAGSKDICGAAILSGLAAMRSGAGMLRIVTHENNRDPIVTVFPEAMVTTYNDKESVSKSEWDKLLRWCDCIAIGPGLGMDENAKLLTSYALHQDLVPVVADADALNILAENPDVLVEHSQDIIITPHVGEMSRLAGLNPAEVASHLIDTSLDFSKSYDVVTVLKDARTVTTDPTGRCVINTKGNSGMATAGSGDVLTGIIAALTAMGLRPFEAASLGVALHAKAGDTGSGELSQEALLARDIIKYLE